MENINGWLVGAIAAIATIISAYFTARLGKHGSRENQLIDQIQEERAAERQERAAEREENAALREAERKENAAMREDLRCRVAEMEKQLKRYQERDRVSHDYIMQLRQHIWDGVAPPPPEWPEDFSWI